MGLKAIIDAQPDMQPAGYATNGGETLRQIGQLFKKQEAPKDPGARSVSPIDVLILDISMPGLNGRETTKQIRGLWPQIPILALSMHEDMSYLRSLIDAGAAGYILKRSAADELVRAVRVVAAGGRYIDPALSETLAQALTREKASLRGEVSGAPLSEREEAVMRLTAQGYANKEIAVQLRVSIKTVETYKARSMEKLGLDSRADLMRHAVAQDWL